jgi:OOP family OmpA-OmpF porin
MRPRVLRFGVVAALATVCAASVLVAPAQAQGPAEIDASVLPLRVDEAVLPINVRESVLPLEDVQTSGTQTKVTLSADVLFAFGKATLTPAARRTVARVGKRLSGARGAVRVDGYTDSVGSDAYNLRLSQRRARAVIAALRSSADGGNRFSARGHGEFSPVAPNSEGGKDNPAGRAKNRRVTISYGKG